MRGEAAYYHFRKDGRPDLRFGRPSGMVSGGTRVDHFQPKWNCAVCAWSARTGHPNFPHTFKGKLHAALRVAA